MFLKGGIKGEHTNKIFIFFILFFNISITPQVSLRDAFPKLTFTAPVDIQNAGDGSNRLFVVEQPGRIRVFENSTSAENHKLFLDISDRVTWGGELGLLGLAFHPEYGTNGYFYVNYTTDESGFKSIISRFRVTTNPDSADAASELKLIEITQPFDNHNGGQLAFGPDGFLYIAFGDGGDVGDPGNNAQNRQSLLGKILRIDVNSADSSRNYGIPIDNPFLENQGDMPEIYAYGLRNPWRFSFDTHTGSLWCADVGQDEWEEINIVVKGGNYGWRRKEGNHCYNPPENCEFPGLISPIWEYSHSATGGFSITGGFVYRGIEVPELFSKYIYGDYVSQNIWALIYDSLNAPINDHLMDAPGNITSFGTDENQELYAALIVGDAGKIYKFTSVTSNDDPGSAAIPENYYLGNAYPNPFNPSTKIEYSIPKSSEVEFSVIDILGKVVYTETTYKAPGNYTLEFKAGSLPSGAYFYKLKAGEFDQVKKFIILK